MFPAYNQHREDVGEYGAYGLSSLAEKTRTSNHFRCYSKGSTFSLVILRPQVLLWSGASTLNYLHSKNTFAM